MAQTAEIIIRAIDRASDVLGRIGATGDRELGRVNRQANLAARSMDAMKVAAVGYLSIVSTTTAYNWLIKTNIQMEQAEVGFKTMLGSAEKAKSFLDDLARFAAKTPFEFTELRTAATKMLAFGFQAQQILPIMKSIGDATAAMGLGAEGVNRITLALGQMKAKAKISAQEMMQLTEAGIPAWAILAEAMGKSTAEIMGLCEKGLIPADKAIQDLIDGMEKRFPNMMEAQSQTFGGMISNLKDLSEIAGRTLGKGLFENLKPVIEDALKSLSRLREGGQLEQWGKNIGNAMAFAIKHGREFLAVLTGFIAMKSVPLFFTTITGAVRVLANMMAFASRVMTQYQLEFALLNMQMGRAPGIIGSVNAAFAAFSKTLGISPFGLIINLVSLAVGIFTTYKIATMGAADAVNKHTEALKKQYKELQNNTSAKKDEIGVIASQMTSLGKLKDEYMTLSAAIKSGKLNEEQLTATKMKLEDVEKELASIVGEAAAKRIVSSKDIVGAFNAEVLALQYRKDKQTKILEEMTRKERDYTLRLITNVEGEITTLQKSREAYGTWAKIKILALKIAPIGMGEGAISAYDYTVAEIDKAMKTITEESKSGKLRELQEDLSNLRQKYISLVPATTEIGKVTENAGNTLKTMGETAKSAGEKAKSALDGYIENASKATGVSEKLIRAVAKVESGFNQAAKSGAGARGIMQIMPGTAAGLGKQLGIPTKTILTEPGANILAGSTYIKQKIAEYNGNIQLALAAYNAGTGNVKKAIARAGTTTWEAVKNFLPKETQDYIPKVLAAMAKETELSARNLGENWEKSEEELRNKISGFSGKLTSALSQVASSVMTASAKSKVELRGTLQDLLVDALDLTTTGEPIGAKLVKSITQALDMLPKAIYDKTGKAGQLLLNLLADLGTQATKVTGEAGYKIVNAISLATLELEERMQQAKKNYEKAMADIQKINSDTNKAIAKETEKYNEDVNKINQKLQEDLKKAYEDYQKNVESVNDKLKNDITSLWEEFEKIVKEKTKSIGNWLDLFEGAPRATKTAPKNKIIDWLKSQVDYLKNYTGIMAQLVGRGIDEGLLVELQNMGPKALPYLCSLADMTDEELAQYVELWKEKNKLAGDEANKELEKTRKEFQDKEEKIRQEARIELDKIYQLWQETMKNLNVDANNQLLELKKSWQDRLAEIRENQKSQLDQILEDAKKFSEEYKKAIEEAAGGGAPPKDGEKPPKDGEKPPKDGEKPPAEHSKYWPYREAINEVVYWKKVWAEAKDKAGREYAEKQAKGYYGQLPSDIVAILKSKNYEQALSWKQTNVYHQGGIITKLGPKDVPIIAQEGEYIMPKGFKPTLITINGPLVAVEKMEVRSDTDIKRVSRELWSLASSNLRALGVK